MLNQGRTTGVAIVMCVHLGIVPPDQTKLEECARKETWIGTVVQVDCFIHLVNLSCGLAYIVVYTAQMF